MYKDSSKRGSAIRPRLLLITFAAVLIWFALPFALQLGSTTTASETDDHPILVATLSGSPIASVTPHGVASYFSTTAANTATKHLVVEVTSVNLAAGTQLTVFLNTTSIGTITLDSMKNGILILPSTPSGSVPTVVSGNTLSVKNGSTTILTGMFSAPPTPTPT